MWILMIFKVFIYSHYQNMWVCVIERNVKWGHAKNDHIKGKRLQQTHSFNYFQSSHMAQLINYFKKHYGNEHSNRHPEAAVITYCHTVGENGLGLNWPHHHYKIIQEVIYQQWFRWHRRWSIVDWTARNI